MTGFSAYQLQSLKAALLVLASFSIGVGHPPSPPTAPLSRPSAASTLISHCTSFAIRFADPNYALSDLCVVSCRVDARKSVRARVCMDTSGTGVHTPLSRHLETTPFYRKCLVRAECNMATDFCVVRCQAQVVIVGLRLVLSSTTWICQASISHFNAALTDEHAQKLRRGVTGEADRVAGYVDSWRTSIPRPHVCNVQYL
jgi:hypothetical protein